MEKLYPVIKQAKTMIGEPTDHGVTLAFCPICNKRLWLKKVDPKRGQPWNYERRLAKSKTGLVGKPIHCEKCGSLIHPLS